MNLLRRLAGLPTIYRTLRPLRLEQARAQVHHAIFGLPAPTRLPAANHSLALATGVVPFLPPPAHVRSRGHRRIELLATEIDLSPPIDWTMEAHGPLVAYHLHQHEYLRMDGFTPADRVECLLDWISRHPRGIGWDPHPISLRLLCWGKLLLTPGALVFAEGERERLLASMVDQAESLSRGLEFRLQANHLFSNLLAVLWAAMLIEMEAPEGGRASEAPRVRWQAWAPRFRDELARQILPDGGHEERSPMYHSLLLENLLDLLNVMRAAPERAPSGLADTIEDRVGRMLGALDVLTHPDGRIALFSDSGFDIAAEPRAIVEYAHRLGVEPARDPGTSPATGDSSLSSSAAQSAVLPATGYVRLVASEVSLLASTAGPAPAHQPGHAHCDALAFELCLGGQRIVTDTGLFEYRPGSRRDRARATGSHSTLQIDEQEQAEIWAAHRVGGRPQVALLAWDGDSTAEASCSGWSRRSTVHRRSFRVGPGEVTILDRIEGPAQRIRFVLPIDPAWQIDLDTGAWRAIGRRAEGVDESRQGHESATDSAPGFEIELPDALTWRLERGDYYPSFGREVERDVLIGEGPAFIQATTRFHWRPATTR